MAVGPLDGRYARRVAPLSAFFSEGALIRYRVRVEVEYLLALVQALSAAGKLREGVDAAELVDKASVVRNWFAVEEDGDGDPSSAGFDFDPQAVSQIAIGEGWCGAHALRVKALERVTNHDVKAVEYFLKERIDSAGLAQFKEYVHFGLTSQDINNTAIPLALREAVEGVVVPAYQRVVGLLREKAVAWMEVPMLAHTHGQAATPTRVGKEFMVWVERLERQLALLAQVPHSAKFGGATGGLNAHVVAYPDMGWVEFADRFIAALGLQREAWTTQISHYDNLAALFDAMKRVNTVLLDVCRDVWQYVSMHYLSQKVVATEVGSSAMPHKVNPIDFENAEGNLGLANAVLEHLSAKLPVSRLQRDLTDSTVLRNLGVPLGHTLVATSSLEIGLNKIGLNHQRVEQDLRDNWLVISEALQTILRRVGFPNPYEALKEVTRGQDQVGKEEIEAFVRTLDVEESVREELLAVTPFTFVGVVPEYRDG